MRKLKFFRLKKGILLPLLLIFVFGTCAAKVVNQAIIRHTAGKIDIDGNLTEPDWERASVVGQFLLYPYRTGEKEITEAKMLWDDECLYIAFKCYDTHISAAKTERNTDVCEDDCVEAFLCPRPQNIRRYINIEINAIGTYNSRVNAEQPIDALTGLPGVDDPKSLHAHWFPPGLQIGRSHKGTINNESDKDFWWIIEMSIPFKSFEILGWSRTPEDRDVWRFNLYRLGGKIDPQRSNLFYLPEGASNHSPQYFGELVFTSKTW